MGLIFCWLGSRLLSKLLAWLDARLAFFVLAGAFRAAPLVCRALGRWLCQARRQVVWRAV